jgi:hypothetical protein
MWELEDGQESPWPLALFLRFLTDPLPSPPPLPSFWYPLLPVSWVPSLALWGGAAGGAVLLFMSKVPIFQHDVLDKIPFIKTFYVGEYHEAWF